MISIPPFKTVRERTFWVRSQLERIGTNFAQLAAANKCSRSAISAAMYMPNHRLEQVIAAALGVRQQDLFPERFTANGKRLHQVKNKAPSPARNVKESRAA